MSRGTSPCGCRFNNPHPAPSANGPVNTLTNSHPMQSLWDEARVAPYVSAYGVRSKDQRDVTQEGWPEKKHEEACQQNSWYAFLLYVHIT